MKWLVLAASLTLQTCLGAIYAWSTFVPALRSAFGLTGGQAGLIFGVAVGLFAISTIPAGMLLHKLGPRRVALAGAGMFAAGYTAASWTQGSFVGLLLCLGVLVGLGTGFGYVCPLATCMRWFPSRKGLITGIAVAGFGGGAMVLSELVRQGMARGIPVLELFRWVGLLYGLAALAGAALLRFPGQETDKTQELSPLKELLRSGQFRALLGGMFAGTFGGLLVVGNLAPMGAHAALPARTVFLSVQAFAAGNAAGRITWGWLYDRFGAGVIPVSLISLLVAITAVSTAKSPGWFLAMAAAAGFCFGSCFVLYAAEVASVFGTHKVGVSALLILGGTTGLVRAAQARRAMEPSPGRFN